MSIGREMWKGGNGGDGLHEGRTDHTQDKTRLAIIVPGNVKAGNVKADGSEKQKDIVLVSDTIGVWFV